MDILSVVVGIVIGLLLGAGSIMFYLRWKMKKQLGMMEEQMGDIMNMTEDLDDEIPEPEGFEEVDHEEVEDQDKKEE